MSLAFIPSLRPLRVTRGGATCRVKKVITADAKKGKGIPKRYSHSGRYHVGYEVSRPDIDMIHDGGDHGVEAHKNQSKGIPRRYATSSRYHVGYEVSRPDVDMIHDKGMHEFVAHAAPAVSPPFKPRKSFASSLFSP